MSQDEAPNITGVQRARLCTMCGTCYAVCPKDNLELVRDGNGMLFYRVRDAERCAGCGLCSRVCPGAYLDLREVNAATFGEVPEDAITGVVRKVFLTRAADDESRLAGASGGTVGALSHWLLESGWADGVLSSTMGTEEDPLAPQSFVARSVEELGGTRGSIYQVAPANASLRGELGGGSHFGFAQKRNSSSPGDGDEGCFGIAQNRNTSPARRLACVGLGCQIRGLRKAALQLCRFRDRIALTIGLFCGHNADRPGTEHLLRRASVRPDQAAEIRFRKGRHPGTFWVRTKDGEEREIPFRQFTYFLTLFENHRCGLCTDPLNALADLSVGDGWLMDKTRAGGWNVTVVRSERGEEALAQAVAAGALIAEEADLDQLERTQTLVLYRRRRGGEAKARLRRMVGTTLPEEPGLRREEPRVRDYVAALKTLLPNWLARGRLRRRLVEAALPFLLWLDERSMRRKNRLAGRDQQWLEQFESGEEE